MAGIAATAVVRSSSVQKRLFRHVTFVAGFDCAHAASPAAVAFVVATVFGAASIVATTVHVIVVVVVAVDVVVVVVTSTTVVTRLVEKGQSSLMIG